jgi:hypothetical protein
MKDSQCGRGISRDGEMGAIMQTNSEARRNRLRHLPFANRDTSFFLRNYRVSEFQEIR